MEQILYASTVGVLLRLKKFLIENYFIEIS